MDDSGEWNPSDRRAVIILPHQTTFVNSGNLNSSTKPPFLGFLQTTKPPNHHIKHRDFWIKPHINLSKHNGFISEHSGFVLLFILGDLGMLS